MIKRNELRKRRRAKLSLKVIDRLKRMHSTFNKLFDELIDIHAMFVKTYKGEDLSAELEQILEGEDESIDSEPEVKRGKGGSRKRPIHDIEKTLADEIEAAEKQVSDSRQTSECSEEVDKSTDAKSNGSPTKKKKKGEDIDMDEEKPAEKKYESSSDDEMAKEKMGNLGMLDEDIEECEKEEASDEE